MINWRRGVEKKKQKSARKTDAEGRRVLSRQDGGAGGTRGGGAERSESA